MTDQSQCKKMSKSFSGRRFHRRNARTPRKFPPGKGGWFRALLPRGTRVYIAHVSRATPIEDMLATARRLGA